MKFIHTKWFKAIEFIVLTAVTILVSLFCALHEQAPVFIKATGWIGVLFFGGGGIYVIYRTIRYRLRGRSPVMITEEGLFVNNDFVQWENITALKDFEGGILVFTNDAEKRINEANILVRWSMKASYKMYGTDICVSDFAIEGTRENFAEQCRPYLERCGK